MHAVVVCSECAPAHRHPTDPRAARTRPPGRRDNRPRGAYQGPGRRRRAPMDVRGITPGISAGQQHSGTSVACGRRQGPVAWDRWIGADPASSHTHPRPPEPMSSPRTQTTVRADDSADQPKRTQLSPVQVAASALAAVSSAVAASIFGVAGTLIGAALASVIATVSTALYTESLRKTNDGLKRVLVGRRTTPVPSAAEPDATQELTATTEPASAHEPAVTRALPAHLDPRRPPAKRRGPRWSRVAVYAVAVFIVAMGVVTGIELIGQKPVSALVGHSQST